MELFALIYGVLDASWAAFCLDGYISAMKNKNVIKFVRIGYLFGAVIGITLCLISFTIAFN